MAGSGSVHNDFNTWLEVKEAFIFDEGETHILAGWLADDTEVFVRFVVRGDSLKAMYELEDPRSKGEWVATTYSKIQRFVQPFHEPTMKQIDRSTMFRQIWALVVEHMDGVPKAKRPTKSIIKKIIGDRAAGPKSATKTPARAMEEPMATTTPQTEQTEQTEPAKLDARDVAELVRSAMRISHPLPPNDPIMKKRREIAQQLDTFSVRDVTEDENPLAFLWGF